MNIQCATACSLEKVNLKFKVLYLLNHPSNFNKICRMCCVNTHIQSESFAQIRSTVTELQHFSRRLFSIGAPCTCARFVSFVLLQDLCHLMLGPQRKPFG